jgi:hypothetical protein
MASSLSINKKKTEPITPKNYGAVNAFGDYGGYVLNRNGKYYATKARPGTIFARAKGQLTTSTSPFSDFEKNWYIERGFGDPTRLVGTATADPKSPLSRVTRSGFGGALIGGMFGSVNKYTYAGVSPEARQLFLLATGGAPPPGPTNPSGVNLGDVTTPTGSGNVSLLPTPAPVPILQDPNEGRSGLRIRRAA